jgi:hypothetical protein
MINKCFKIDFLLMFCCFTTIIYWYFLYNSYTLEYDENVNNFVYSFPISIITILCLIIYSKRTIIKGILHKSLFYFILIFGTPITYLLIISYFLTLKMNYENTTYSNEENSTSEVTKFKNIFEAENTLIIAYKNKIDTIKATVTSKGKIKRIYKVNKGNEININIKTLDYIPKKKLEEITKY